MPLSEYADSIGGGLKLKGVKDSRVKKHKKKKHITDPSNEDKAVDPVVEKQEQDDDLKDVSNEEQAKEKPTNRYGKTDTQLRHEERRRKMMDERMKREGAKSHKEKVEDLNKYLSKLSEHHDMPRIGPG